jgi:hypothetical protein
MAVVHVAVRTVAFAFPTSLFCWLLIAGDVVALTFAGEYACIRRDAAQVALGPLSAGVEMHPVGESNADDRAEVV